MFKSSLFFGIIKSSNGRIIIIDAIENGAKFNPNMKSEMRIKYLKQRDIFILLSAIINFTIPIMLYLTRQMRRLSRTQ